MQACYNPYYTNADTRWLDFFEEPPQSEGVDTNLVVMDRRSNTTIFGFEASFHIVASHLFEEILVLHNFRDQIFVSNFGKNYYVYTALNSKNSPLTTLKLMGKHY